ncbi:proline dehydrogenase family protein [Myxococcaceae bacterium GXIMD 01537]
MTPAVPVRLSRAALLFLSRREGLRRLALRLRPLRALSRRFVAGETLDEALDAVGALNARGMLASLDHLNEAVREEAETHEEVREYQRLLARVEARGLAANVSLKLTQCGLLLDEGLARENARQVVAEAARRGSFVRVDMEQSALTQATLDTVLALHAEFGEERVGAVLQSYLRRTEEDARELCARGVRLRLCKGAYMEGPEVAFTSRREVDESFLRALRVLLDSGLRHGIATHDERLVEAALALADERGLAPGAFEFEMLLGIRADLQQRLAREGWPVRVYVPYGRAWYPYLMRRLAERPANLRFLLRHLWRG